MGVLSIVGANHYRVSKYRVYNRYFRLHCRYRYHYIWSTDIRDGYGHAVYYRLRNGNLSVISCSDVSLQFLTDFGADYWQEVLERLALIHHQRLDTVIQHAHF